MTYIIHSLAQNILFIDLEKHNLPKYFYRLASALTAIICKIIHPNLSNSPVLAPRFCESLERCARLASGIATASSSAASRLRSDWGDCWQARLHLTHTRPVIFSSEKQENLQTPKCANPQIYVLTQLMNVYYKSFIRIRNFTSL